MRGRRRPITTEAIGSAATHPSLRGAFATKQSRGHNMRGGSNPDGRIAAPGLLRFARNDGQGIGSLVSACRLGCLLDRKMIGGFIEDEPQGRQYPGRAASYIACHGG